MSSPRRNGGPVKDTVRHALSATAELFTSCLPRTERQLARSPGPHLATRVELVTTDRWYGHHQFDVEPQLTRSSTHEPRPASTTNSLNRVGPMSVTPSATSSQFSSSEPECQTKNIR